MNPLGQSWGRFPKANSQRLISMFWRDDALPSSDQSLIPYGNGRSYGDSCLNEGQTLLLTRGMDRVIAFDRSQGILRCEAGMTFEDVLQLAIPAGWFLPVTPGTQYITVGGAVANDVHGKNHHRAGNFGHHVIRFELLRSDGSRKVCESPRHGGTQNTDAFEATLGGLGLTGLITWVEFRLIPIHNPWITQEVVRFEGLGEFLALNRESEQNHDYTVAWIDSLSRGKKLGRGLYIRGDHASPDFSRQKLPKARALAVPFDAPSITLNPLSIKLFNFAYYHRQFAKTKRSVVSYVPFFYPLDSIRQWNRIYGKRGFLQYQCVVPIEQGGCDAIQEILDRTSRAHAGSFLSVLKTFGQIPSLGLLSFPRPGVTLALDFPNSGPKLFQLLEELDQVVRQAGGAVYPAKDARMSAESFHQFFPRAREFERWVDPAFSSSFWRRVNPV